MLLQCGTRVQRCAARFVKKDYRYATSVTGLLDELGWLPLFERRKHFRLTVFHKALNSLSAVSLDHLSVSSQHTTASNKNKFVTLPICQFILMSSNIHFFPRTITDWNSLPLAVHLLQSTQSFHRTRHPPTVADYHDTPAVTGGLHPLLDIAPKNRQNEQTNHTDHITSFANLTNMVKNIVTKVTYTDDRKQDLASYC